MTCLVNHTQKLTTIPCTSNTSLPPANFCPPPGIFILCGTTAYTCVPENLEQAPCLYVFLTPNLSVRTEGKLESSLTPAFPHSRQERAALVPLLVGTGVLTAVGTGVGEISSSVHFYHKLSTEFSEDIALIGDSIESLQRQIDSLAAVALQNRRALDLLTAEKGGTCIFLGEECCYFVNESGIIKDHIKTLRDRISQRWREEAGGMAFFSSLAPWLLPLLGPLTSLLLILLFGPCLMKCLTSFLQNRIQALTNAKVGELYLALNLEALSTGPYAETPMSASKQPQPTHTCRNAV